mgnify:CR=1 FL=1
MTRIQSLLGQSAPRCVTLEDRLPLGGNDESLPMRASTGPGQQRMSNKETGGQRQHRSTMVIAPPQQKSTHAGGGPTPIHSSECGEPPHVRCLAPHTMKMAADASWSKHSEETGVRVYKEGSWLGGGTAPVVGGGGCTAPSRVRAKRPGAAKPRWLETQRAASGA